MLNVRTLLAGALLVPFLPFPLHADWIQLVDGTELRGIDFLQLGKTCRFTLEDGRTVRLPRARVASHRRSPAGEKVEFRGQEVSLREKVKAVQEEEKKRRKEALRSLETWARGKEGADEARRSFEALPPEDRVRFLAAALLESKVKEARLLASRGLKEHRDRATRSTLAHAAMSDAQEPVRKECLSTLEAQAEPATGELFIPYLRSASSDDRVRAMRALESFPTRKAVPALIETIRLSWSGFGRGFFSHTEQRAFIADYELVSGGTGFTVIEVADPVVNTVSTGVVLDVKVRQVEVLTRRRVLGKLTGQDFGEDLARWREWWKANGEK